MWGEMTSQEMMLPWFGVVVDRDSQPDKIASYRPGDFDGQMSRFTPLKPGVAAPGVPLPAPMVQPAILRSVKRQ
jgi:hypothetical protein